MSADDFVYRPPGAPKPKEPAYSEDGVDLTLIRLFLSMSPEQRLSELQSMQDFIEGVRTANPGWTLAES